MQAINNGTIKKFFFIRSDRLGEFLLSLYAIKLIKNNYPQSKIYLLAKKENLDLIHGVDFIDYFLEYDDNVFKGVTGAFSLSSVLRKEKIDCVITLNPKKEFHFAGFFAGVALRVGYNRKWGWCLNRKIKDEKYLCQKHEVKYNLDLARLLCPNAFTPEMNLKIDGKDSLSFLQNDLDINKRYIVIHPFTSNPAKKIEILFWKKLISTLKDRSGENIVLVGGPDELEESKTFAESLAVKNLTAHLTLRNLAAFLNYNCSVFIGLDSGPMHLASILKRPVVGLFNISDAKRWGPFNTKSLVVKSLSTDGFLERIDDIVKFTCPNTLTKI